MIRYVVTHEDGTRVELSARDSGHAVERAARWSTSRPVCAQPQVEWQAAEAVRVQAEYDRLGIVIVGSV